MLFLSTFLLIIENLMRDGAIDTLAYWITAISTLLMMVATIFIAIFAGQAKRTLIQEKKYEVYPKIYGYIDEILSGANIERVKRKSENKQNLEKLYVQNKGLMSKELAKKLFSFREIALYNGEKIVNGHTVLEINSDDIKKIKRLKQ